MDYRKKEELINQLYETMTGRKFSLFNLEGSADFDKASGVLHCYSDDMDYHMAEIDEAARYFEERCKELLLKEKNTRLAECYRIGYEAIKIMKGRH